MTQKMAATAAQLTAAIAKRGTMGGSAAFHFVFDAEKSPYRARGMPVFTLIARLSWLDADITLVDGLGRSVALDYAKACEFCGSLMWGAAPMSLSVTVSDGQIVPPVPTAARFAKVAATAAADHAALAAAVAEGVEWEEKADGSRRRSKIEQARNAALALAFANLS